MTPLRSQLIASCYEEGLTPRLVAPERTLADVLRDIAEVGPVVWASSPYTDDDVLSDALDRLADLQNEARAMVETATGCTWDQLQGACL